MAQGTADTWPNEKLAIPAWRRTSSGAGGSARIQAGRTDPCRRQQTPGGGDGGSRRPVGAADPAGEFGAADPRLSQALDFYQQASELQPQDQGLPRRRRTPSNSLSRRCSNLRDHLTKAPQKESLEQQAARLKGRKQALNQLQGLNPSEETGEKAEQVGEELEGVRQGSSWKRGHAPAGTGNSQPASAVASTNGTAGWTPSDPTPQVPGEGSRRS